jgi:hypothetical protein
MPGPQHVGLLIGIFASNAYVTDLRKAIGGVNGCEFDYTA